MSFNQYDVHYNRDEINTAVAICVSAADPFLSKAKAAELAEIIHQFATRNKISLYQNLQSEERDELHAIIAQALKLDLKKEADQINQLLTEWKERLKFAVVGRGAGNQLYGAHSSSFAATLRNTGNLRASEWGTDLDLIQFLGEEISDVRDINAPGVYVLPPLALIDPKSTPQLNLQDKLDKVLDSVNRNNISGEVALLIPASCGNHWRLAEIKIKNKKIKSAELWDSFSEEIGRNRNYSASLNHLQQALDLCNQEENVKVTSFFAGEQKDCYSCMDRVLQRIVRLLPGNDSELAKVGNDSQAIRLAVVKQIVRNHPQFADKAADHIQLVDNKISFSDTNTLTEKRELDVTRKEEIWEQLKVDPIFRDKFDGLFAAELQRLYDSDKCEVNETKLQEIAFSRAFGLFSPRLPASPKADSKAAPASPTKGM